MEPVGPVVVGRARQQGGGPLIDTVEVDTVWQRVECEVEQVGDVVVAQVDPVEALGQQDCRQACNYRRHTVVA
jgi:hypothetical protein